MVGVSFVEWTIPKTSSNLQNSSMSICPSLLGLRQELAAGLWFSLGTQVSSTNKTDCYDITEILLKVALNAIPEALKSLYRSPGNKKKQLGNDCTDSCKSNYHAVTTMTAPDFIVTVRQKTY
jgi:hypothetical protein